jgi:hypothetical protein
VIWVCDIDDHAALAQVRIVQEFEGVEDGSSADTGGD